MHVAVHQRQVAWVDWSFALPIPLSRMHFAYRPSFAKYIFRCVNTDVIHAYMYVSTYIYVCVYMRICMNIYIYIHMCMYASLHIYIYTNIQPHGPGSAQAATSSGQVPFEHPPGECTGLSIPEPYPDPNRAMKKKLSL